MTLQVKALSVSMNFLEDIINNIPDAICIIDCASNKIKFVNDAFSDQLVSREMIINQSFENNILLSDFSEHCFEKIQESKLSSNEVELGICKSLSSVGKEKCKHILLLVPFVSFNFEF